MARRAEPPDEALLGFAGFCAGRCGPGPAAIAGDPIRDTVGGWKGLIDADAFKRNIYADRLITTRPDVTL